MGVYTYTMADCTSTVAATRLFNALCLDNHNLFPKAVPEMTKSIEFVEGDSTTAGCIKQINFSEGAPFKYVKHRMDEIDTTKLYVKYTSIEGDVLGDTLEFVVNESTFEAVGTGCHAKMVAHFHTKGDYVMKDEEIAHGKVAVQKLFNAVEAYLIANPQLYA